MDRPGGGTTAGYVRGTILISALYLAFGGALFATGIAITFGGEPLTAAGWALATFMGIGLVGWLTEAILGGALEAVAERRMRQGVATGVAMLAQEAAIRPDLGSQVDLMLPVEPARPSQAVAAYAQAGELESGVGAARAALPPGDQGQFGAPGRGSVPAADGSAAEFVELRRAAPAAGSPADVRQAAG